MRISSTQAQNLSVAHGTPLYVYSLREIRQRAYQLQALNLPYGVTVRYAMKANPHPQIIHTLVELELQFDAGSSYEANHLLELGVPGSSISLSSQQPAHNLGQLLEAGVSYVATSLHQMELYAQAAMRGARLGLRVNPGIGSGHNNRTTTGGVTSSFGLWHEYLDDALALARQHGLVIDKLHIHAGSGADPSVWGAVMDAALNITTRLPDVVTLDIGGGYKVRRVPGEAETDMKEVVAVFAHKLHEFAVKTGRRLYLEIEPGTWLVAHAGVLLTEIVDIVDTGSQGFTFLRTDTGMNDLLRPSLYGAQHRMQVMNRAAEYRNYVVVGHNCETGDILTTAPHDSERIAPRKLRRAAIGDVLAIADTGAYGAAMSAHGYNAYPSAKEVCVD